MNMDEIKRLHPMPWRYMLMGNNVQLVDSAGKELPMFLMLDFVSFITTQIAGQSAKPAQS